MLFPPVPQDAEAPVISGFLTRLYERAPLVRRQRACGGRRWPRRAPRRPADLGVRLLPAAASLRSRPFFLSRMAHVDEDFEAFLAAVRRLLSPHAAPRSPSWRKGRARKKPLQENNRFFSPFLSPCCVAPSPTARPAYCSTLAALAHALCLIGTGRPSLCLFFLGLSLC